jgi:hypothetical protein
MGARPSLLAKRQGAQAPPLLSTFLFSGLLVFARAPLLWLRLFSTPPQLPSRAFRRRLVPDPEAWDSPFFLASSSSP